MVSEDNLLTMNFAQFRLLSKGEVHPPVLPSHLYTMSEGYDNSSRNVLSDAPGSCG